LAKFGKIRIPRKKVAMPDPNSCWRYGDLADLMNGQLPDTGLSGVAAPVAARPEPAPTLGRTGEKKPTENGWFFE